MVHEFVKTFLLIFIAEIGDKTQVLLMTCAAKYSMLQVIIGIFIGVALNHGLAIIIGIYISNIIATNLLQICAGIIFILFGLYSFNEYEEKSKDRALRCGPILAVTGTFLLGELGDKTQLTAMTIAMESKYPFFVLLGSISGMIAVGCIGIIIGTALTKKIPSYIIKMLSGLIFIAFGVIKLFTKSNLFVCGSFYPGIIIIVIFLISLFLIKKLVMNR